MFKACLYARFSTDKQAESSIDDQYRICRQRIKREGWQETAHYSDMAVSGSTSVEGRPGGAALLADAMAGRFDVLILEGLDRLSRDQVEQERIVRRLEHRNIRIIGVSDGYDSTLAARKVLRGVRGLINELYLDDLRHKTHRGQAGLVERGYIAGGHCYGYDIVRDTQGSKYQINEVQARHIKWIFERYAAGASVQSIAHELNRQGIRSPRQSTWAVSAIYGHPAKWSGILNNRLYVGQYVWNRSQWIKDPDTGRRQRLVRPQSEWKFTDVPDLAIVSQDIWEKVRARIDAGRDEFGRKRSIKQGSSLFGGTLRCPYCGGAMIKANGLKYGCAASKDRGPSVCRGFLIRCDLVDSRLITMVRENLLSPVAAQRFEEIFKEKVASEKGGMQTEIDLLQKQLKSFDTELEKLVDAIATVGISEALAGRLKKLEAEKAKINSRLTALDSSPRDQIPDIQGMFKSILMRLNDEIAHDAQTAKTILAGIFGRVELELRGDGEVWGKVETAQALEFALEPSRMLVAGAGFEPTTFGL